MLILKNKKHNQVIANKIHVCRGYFSRIKGLLGSSRIEDKEACWIIPCGSVHTFGMKYAIDVYFLDKKHKIIGIVKDLKPNRVSPLFWFAHSVLELATGIDRNCTVGDELVLEDHHDHK